MSTTSAASIATSAPAPIAMPISALVSAGASFTPSPTIMTFPFSLRLRMMLSLPSGSTPAMTSSTPAFAPIAFAVRSLSPVSITTCMPMFRICSMACGLSSFMTSATAIMPISAPPRAKSSGVFPSSDRCSALFAVSSDTAICPLMNLKLPPRSSAPSSDAVRPFPGKASKRSLSKAARLSCSAL